MFEMAFFVHISDLNYQLFGFPYNHFLHDGLFAIYAHMPLPYNLSGTIRSYLQIAQGNRFTYGVQRMQKDPGFALSCSCYLRSSILVLINNKLCLLNQQTSRKPLHGQGRTLWAWGQEGALCRGKSMILGSNKRGTTQMHITIIGIKQNAMSITKESSK